MVYIFIKKDFYKPKTKTNTMRLLRRISKIFLKKRKRIRLRSLLFSQFTKQQRKQQREQEQLELQYLSQPHLIERKNFFLQFSPYFNNFKFRKSRIHFWNYRSNTLSSLINFYSFNRDFLNNKEIRKSSLLS